MIAIKYLHLVALLFLFAASLGKNILLVQTPLQEQHLYWARLADKVSASAVGILLLTGVSLAFFTGKGSHYYLSNPLFLAKMAILVLASFLILRTKKFFRQHAKQHSSIPVQAAPGVVTILRIDAISILVMMLLAMLVAQGWGDQL